MSGEVEGEVKPGYEAVADAFRRNLIAGTEVGAACAVSVGGELVVDLWAGSRDPRQGLRWEEDTLVNMFSTTKGVSSIALAHGHSRGLFDYDKPVAEYWPEFAVEGKELVTIRQLLSHQAGLCAIDALLDIEKLADPDQVAAAFAAESGSTSPRLLTPSVSTIITLDRPGASRRRFAAVAMPVPMAVPSSSCPA